MLRIVMRNRLTTTLSVLSLTTKEGCGWQGCGAQLWHDVRLESTQRAISFCGGVYFGALELFAPYQLGHEDISLYDRSWAEWESDPDLPVETGSGEHSASTETSGRLVGLAGFGPATWGRSVV